MNSTLFHRFIALFLFLSLCFFTFPSVAFASVLPQPSLPDDSESAIPNESLPEEPIAQEPSEENTIPTEESLPPQSQPESSLPEESTPPDQHIVRKLTPPTVSAGPGLYFGQLHAHTDISDGTGTVEEAFQYASQVEGLDFFAVTDHSESFDQHTLGQIGSDAHAVSNDWATGKDAAAAVTTDSFVGLFGYEMSWPYSMQIGHISTFNTPGFQSWQQDAFSSHRTALKNYYDTLCSVPGSISQFNHPGTKYGTFESFEYSAQADQVITLLEVGSGEGAVGSSGYYESYKYYTKALDLGWHVSPTNNQANHNGRWGNANTAKTVVYAKSLTEAHIYDALRNCRTYATEDADLEILYTMDGHFMGSQLNQNQIGESADISVTLLDPTDSSIGLVEVITCGGTDTARQTVSSNSGTVTFSLPPDAGYYYLRITQPDRDTAVTAPIWINETEDLGISALTCETVIPTQNEPLELKLDLYNDESADFLVDSLEILADGSSVEQLTDLTVLPGSSHLSHSFSIALDCVGQTAVSVILKGTLNGMERTYEASVSINLHQAVQISNIAVDCSHDNAGTDRLSVLKALAVEENIQFTQIAENTAIPEDHRFLLISAPKEPFSQAFIDAVSAYAGSGGSLILCGQADGLDRQLHSAAELNRILAAVGSTMQLQDDSALDSVTHGSASYLLYLDDFNMESEWCTGIESRQTYRHAAGCTIDPGDGTWLVKGRSTTHSVDGDGDGLGNSDSGSPVVLACESLSGGGTVFAAGSLFLSDPDITPPKNIWDIPYANRTFCQTLLNIGGESIPLSTIQQARNGAENQLFRIRGYVTAGTSNPYNTFPNTLYLQDDTGGIAITPFSGEPIQIGTPMEITGYSAEQDGNRILKLSSHEILDADFYNYEPMEGPWRKLLNPAANEGTLVAVEGECLEIYCRDDRTLAGCLLKDRSGNRIRILVEDCIFSGSDGINRLHNKIRKGRTVHAAGILHVDGSGTAVIRVRNCDEVVYVPPADSFNPPTGDAFGWHLISRLFPFITCDP